MQINSFSRSGALSLMIHGGLVLLLQSASQFERAKLTLPQPRLLAPLVSPFFRTPAPHEAGGSARGAAPLAAGRLPKRATRVFIAPVVARPMLPMEITIDAPDVAVDNRLPSYGDPLAGLLTGGLGTGDGGYGNGKRGGIGDSDGSGVSGAPTVYRPGNGVSAPQLIHSVEPVFSEEARRAKFSGSVSLRIDVDPTGHARNIRVVRSAGMGLDEKAIEAVAQWLFKPGMRAGKAVTVSALVDVSFHLL
jgi:TonB family protein